MPKAFRVPSGHFFFRQRYKTNASTLRLNFTMKLNLSLAVALCVLFSFMLHAQVPATIWQPNVIKRPVALPYLREADIGWAKRVWRTIDLREKLNHRLYFPTEPNSRYTSLYDVFLKGALTGQLTVFNAHDDEFSGALSKELLISKLSRHDTVHFFETDDEGVEHEVNVITDDTVQSADILQYWIKEDWFFDTKRSVLDVRIVGICPVKYDQEKEMLIPLFWVYFNEARPLLAANKVMTTGNDAIQLTYDDLFLKRMFSSFIYKESNVYDRSIAQYLQGSEMLLEADRIKEGIFNMESDLWHR
jgi:gliding motility associated protien GldN